MPRTAGTSDLPDTAIWMVITNPGMTSVALAGLLGISPNTVRNIRMRYRESGWACKVRYGVCEVCGEPYTAGARRVGKQAYHSECRPAALKQINKRLSRERFEKMSAEEKNRRLDFSHTYERDVQNRTLQSATNRGAPWDSSEELVLLENPKVPHHLLAMKLGRTLYSVRGRVKKLRELGLIIDDDVTNE